MPGQACKKPGVYIKRFPDGRFVEVPTPFWITLGLMTNIDGEIFG